MFSFRHYAWHSWLQFSAILLIRQGNPHHPKPGIQDPLHKQPNIRLPKHYKEFVHNPTSKVCNELSRLGSKVLPHMCGDIVKTGIVDMLLEMDIHGIMPGNLTQEKVLDIRELKEKVKDQICIFDNINPNGPLLIGKPDEVAKETLLHLNRAKGMTGYIFSTAGTSSPATPKENYLAMDREVANYQL